jgi:hypothetical protein
MSRVNGATNALSIGPSAGYTMFFVFVHISLLFTAYASSYTHMHIHVITYITLFFWIKLKLKMPKFLTVWQTPWHPILSRTLPAQDRVLCSLLARISSNVAHAERDRLAHLMAP